MLRIKDWDDLYETSETRKYQYLRWFPVPNKFDGKGFKRLSRHEFAPAIYTAWVHMLAFASKLKKGLRGSLIDRDGPLTPRDMADKTGYPQDMYEMAIPVLLDPDIGWLEEVKEEGEEDDLPESAGITADDSRYQQIDPEDDQGDHENAKTGLNQQNLLVSAVTAEDNISELNRREEKSIEEKKNTTAPPPVPMVQYLQTVGDWVKAMRSANLASWEVAYPAINIPIELAQAGLWLVNNSKTKKKKNFGRFFQNWCKTSQESGGGNYGNSKENAAKADEQLMAELEKRIRTGAEAADN